MSSIQAVDAVDSACEWRGYEEPEEDLLRERVGLRPVALPGWDEADRAHPDPYPCPSWCSDLSEGRHHRFDSEMLDSERPVCKRHHMDTYPSIRLDLYPRLAVPPGWVTYSTVSGWLTQEGNLPPVIVLDSEVHLDPAERSGGETTKAGPELRLSVEDARDLIAMLGHLVGLVEADQTQRAAREGVRQ